MNSDSYIDFSKLLTRIGKIDFAGFAFFTIIQSSSLYKALDDENIPTENKNKIVKSIDRQLKILLINELKKDKCLSEPDGLFKNEHLNSSHIYYLDVTVREELEKKYEKYKNFYKKLKSDLPLWYSQTESPLKIENNPVWDGINKKNLIIFSKQLHLKPYTRPVSLSPHNLVL